MAAAQQLRLLDDLAADRTDDGQGEPWVGAATERRWLDEWSWVDIGRDWLRGADALLRAVTAPGVLAWEQRQRPMYGRMVDEPRLTAELRLDRHRTGGVTGTLRDLTAALSNRYGEPLTHLWANWYRSGDDAVAWHSDRIGRTHPEPVVAIVSLGGPRRFLMRPRRPGTGGPQRWTLHGGDLLVMGGACQRRWEHSVPRQRGGPERVSLTFRRPPGPPAGGVTAP